MNLENLKAAGIWILVRLEKAEETTKSGLVIPVTTKSRSARGVVKSVGSQVKDISPDTTVYWPEFAGIEVDSEHVVLTEQDVILHG